VSANIRFGLGGLAAQSIRDDRAGYGREIALLVKLAQEAEATGFDSVWVTEHHVSTDGYLPAPLVALGALAVATQRVQLGTNIALAPLFQPIRLAEEAAFLDQLSRGRLILGLGLGYRPEEFAAFGVGADPGERVARLQACLDVLRTAWSGREISVGTGSETLSLTVRPLPTTIDGPPIWLGAWVEAGVRRARKIADGYIAPVGTVKDLGRRLTWLREEGQLDDFPIAISLNGFVGGADAWDRVAGGVEHVLGNYRRWYEASGDPAATGRGRISPATTGPPPHFVVGTPDQCVDALTPLCRFLSSNVQDGHILIRLTFPGLSEADALRSVRLFGTEVVPALREIIVNDVAQK
jgi:alkanesulfonate monooxygenase SsuD/methylene tetrahydromethanopterin reductase-like flavin-dependent oxidoreductase (luciferase family)